jgi:hypothetical protein
MTHTTAALRADKMLLCRSHTLRSTQGMWDTFAPQVQQVDQFTGRIESRAGDDETTSPTDGHHERRSPCSTAARRHHQQPHHPGGNPQGPDLHRYCIALAMLRAIFFLGFLGTMRKRVSTARSLRLAVLEAKLYF